MVSEANALPTEHQPLPIFSHLHIFNGPICGLFSFQWTKFILKKNVKRMMMAMEGIQTAALCDEP